MLQMMDGHDMYQVFSLGNFKEIFVRGGLMEENHRNNYTFLRTVLFSFWITGGQLSQCFAVSSSVFFLQKLKQKPVLGGNIQILLYILELYISVSSNGPALKKHSKEL